MIDEIISMLEEKIQIESAHIKTSEQENYVVGLADALELIKEYISIQPQIGKQYYVIVNADEPYIEQMYLYRINNKMKTAYCFTRDMQTPSADLVLYSKRGLKMRVFETLDDAKTGLPYFILYKEEEKQFRWRKRKT